MRKVLSVLIGTVLLAAALVVVWIAHGPQAKEERVTGGVLYSQQEIAAQIATSPGDPELGTVFDADVGAGAAVIEQRPQLEAQASADLGTVDAAEAATVPETVPMDASLTTDIVLDNEVDVAVAPLGGPAGLDSMQSGQGGATNVLTGYEQRVVELEWPSELQVGRSGLVRVKLRVLAGGALQPVAEVADNQVLATPILITDRYDTHTAIVTANLSAPDFEVSWTNNLAQPMERGSEPEWRWTLKANDSGSALIVIGLTLTWQAKVADAPPAPANVPIWGQTVQVEVNHVFGLITVPQASILATALAVVGFVAEVPLLGLVLETTLGIVFGGRRRRRRREDDRRRRRRR